MTKTKRWIGMGVASGMIAGGAYLLWKRSQRGIEALPAMPADQAHRLLARAAPLLRLPTSAARQLDVLPDGSGLRCPATGQIYPYRNGVLDLLESELGLTETQKALDTPFTAWAYDRFRGALTRLLSSPDFPVEVAIIQEKLQAQAGDTILDLACGPGNLVACARWASSR